ncbi:methyl-accepting chemotaxis protein [Pseudanabaena sp. PCC 6802]|uniref:methyl-accepting chemotaxis protein n=1 Tax=Pseudanabaena sp. PCC 6802 TaxID=118173 RepID=UPI000348A238|nr:methyl-accepting chemotaxis protein [Pseudanabaena sp. PCC 6802]
MSNARYEGALEAYRAGRYEDAIQQLLELLREDPENPELHVSLADSYRYAGQVDNANWHYQQVFKLSDDPELISYAVGAVVPSAQVSREKVAASDRSSEPKSNPKGVEHNQSSDRPARAADRDSARSDELDDVDSDFADLSHLPSPMSSDANDGADSPKPAISVDTPANPGHSTKTSARSTRQKHKKSDRSTQLHLKVVGLAIALAAIPVTAVGLTAYYLSSQSLRQEVKRAQEYKATSLSRNLHRFLLNQYENAKMLGGLFTNSDTPAKPKLRQKLQLQNRLNLYKQAYKSFDGIAIFDTSGKLVAQSSGNSIPSTIDPKTLQRVMRGNTTVIAKPTAVEQTYVIDFAAPIANPATQRVELAIQARMTLPHLLDALGGNEAGNFFVVNADGNYVLATDTSLIGKDATGNYPVVLKELLAANSIDTKEAILDGEKKLLSYVPPVQLAGLPELNWRSLTSIDENKALASLRGVWELCLIGAVLSLILVGAIAYFISRLWINRIRTAKNTVEEVLADRANLDNARDDLDALLKGVEEIANLQDLFEQQTIEGQHLQQQRTQLFKALQKLAQVETADLQISNESISFLVEKVQAQLAQRDSKDIAYLQQLIAQQHADQERRQQQSTAILHTIQELNRSNSEAIAQTIAQIGRLTTSTDARSEPGELTISDRSIDAIAARVAQFDRTNTVPNTLTSEQGGQEIGDLVLQLIDQQRAERDRLQQQTTEILHAIQALNRSDTSSQEPQEITISDRSLNSLAERVQAQIGQRDISELLLQLAERQQAEQERLQRQSAEILSALQALSQSNNQLSDRLIAQTASQAPTQPELQELTISEASINSMAERVQARIAQPEIGDRLQALQQLVEQQYAERQHQQEQTAEILNAIQELSQSNARLNVELSDRLNERLTEQFANQAPTQPEPQDLSISEASIDALANRVTDRVTDRMAGPDVDRDVSDILQQLIEQQHAAQEQSQQQSESILSAIQQLAEATKEPPESIVSDRSIDLLVSRLQAQFPLQTSADETELEAIEQLRALEARPEDELSKAFDDVFDKLDELDELDEILQASQPKSTLEQSGPIPAGIPALSGMAPEQLKQAIAQATSYLQRIEAALRHSEQATAQISADAIRQVDEITCTVDFLQTMAASIQSAADMADRFASTAHTASDSALTSNQAIEQSAEAIAQLRATIAATAKKVKRLGESSQHISKVSALINEVAVRTNYLAINASLEASRSGSDSRGFTNIAEEVGELATRSAAATKEIEELIDNIQADSGEVINFMELGTTQVVECTQLVEAAKQNLQQIAIASQQINQLAEPMVEFTASQTTNSGSIANLIQDIAHISQRTTRSSQQLNQSLQDTAESLEQLRLTVSQLELEQ